MLQLIPKVREAIRAEGVAIGIEKGKVEGRAEGRAEVKDWWERKTAAERAGLSFDEPPRSDGTGWPRLYWLSPEHWQIVLGKAGEAVEIPVRAVTYDELKATLTDDSPAAAG